VDETIPVPAAGHGSPGADSPVNLLLVDDEARNLDVLEMSLEAPGHNLVRALTAERALLFLLDREFAAIVLDINMPGMNGIELANLIKQRRRTEHIPIIFLTAYFQEDKDILEGYGSGAVDYLTKPVNPQILRSKIAVFVDLFRKTRALAESNEALELEVAQRQKAEESLRKINAELESRVQARMGDLVRVNDELRGQARALGASQAQLRLVTDHAPVFITQIDREHRFKFANRTYATSLGLEPEQLLGRHCSEVLGEARYDAIRHHIVATLEGRRVEFEAEITDPALGRRWVYVVHEPERAPEGEVIGLVSVSTDITERKLAEQQIAAARDEALEASRMKDGFLAQLSHELRTPLNPVLLLASEAVGNRQLSPEVRADFETIAQNVLLEARLIDDLLDLTMITQGKLALNLRPVEIHSILREALDVIRKDFTQKDLVVELRLAAERQTVVGDDGRLKQVFWNVIKNAAKFTPAGGRIVVATVVAPRPDRLVVTVTDTGIGMTNEEVQRAFAAFAQGDHANGRSHKFGGLGLGLAISQKLVELHSGAIFAASPGRDQGSTFSIELPLCPDGHRAAPPSSPPFKAGQRPTLRQPFRVLLVEDHKPTCFTLATLLTRRHYQVVTANSLGEARDRATRENLDFVVSDIGLPDGNGCDLMAELRDRHGLSGIALTGYGTEEDLNRSHAAGFITHLTKPVTAQALDNALALIANAQAIKRRAQGPQPT
jgi:PAS domain S-box-containing protein